MKNLILHTLLITCMSGLAQVGLGETNPTAMLEVNAAPTGIPALKLSPQTDVEGTATGQLAFVGGKLYVYDAATDRNKWLSVESTTFEFGRLGNDSDIRSVEYVGDIEFSGPLMPFAGTIVKVTMQARQNNNNIDISLLKNNVGLADNANPNKDPIIKLDSNNTYINDNYSIDFNAGDWFRWEVDGEKGIILDLTILMTVKWRVENP